MRLATAPRSMLAALAMLLPVPLGMGAFAQQPVQELPPETAFKNVLVCGDASTCPWQRGTSIASIANTLTFTADWWGAIGGASSSITVSQQTNTSVQGFTKAMRFQRANGNANTAAINLGQVLDTADFGTSLQGKNVCFSFLVQPGATFSANLGTLSYNLVSGTGSNQGLASMIAGTWTGTNTFASGTVLVPPTTLTQAVTKCGQVPGTATEIGVFFSFTPVGTAGATDFVDLLRIQLEGINPSALVQATNFERRSATMELWLAEARAYVLAEPAASISVGPSGQGASTTTCVLTIPFPRTMRAAPTFTATGTALGATTWTVTHVVTNSVLSTPFMAATTGGHTTTMANLTATTGAVLTAGQTCTLTGAGGGSTLTFSADL